MEHIKQQFCSDAWIMPWWVGLGLGGRLGKKNLFLVAYQIDRDDEQNRMQVKFSPEGQTGDLRVWSKVQISFTKSISKIFIPDFVFSQIKDINLQGSTLPF